MSVWSSISSGSEGGRRRSSFVGLFTKKGSVDKPEVEFREVDIEGKGSES